MLHDFMQDTINPEPYTQHRFLGFYMDIAGCCLNRQIKYLICQLNGRLLILKLIVCIGYLILVCLFMINNSTFLRVFLDRILQLLVWNHNRLNFITG